MVEKCTGSCKILHQWGREHEQEGTEARAEERRGQHQQNQYQPRVSLLPTPCQLRARHLASIPLTNPPYRGENRGPERARRCLISTVGTGTGASHRKPTKSLYVFFFLLVFLAIDSVKEKAFIDQIIDFNKTNNQNFEQAREKLKLEYALGNGNQLN